jgi:hypothetical protein
MLPDAGIPDGPPSPSLGNGSTPGPPKENPGCRHRWWPRSQPTADWASQPAAEVPNDLTLSCEQPTDRRDGGVRQLQRRVGRPRATIGPSTCRHRCRTHNVAAASSLCDPLRAWKYLSSLCRQHAHFPSFCSRNPERGSLRHARVWRVSSCRGELRPVLAGRLNRPRLPPVRGHLLRGFQAQVARPSQPENDLRSVVLRVHSAGLTCLCTRSSRVGRPGSLCKAVTRSRSSKSSSRSRGRRRQQVGGGLPRVDPPAAPIGRLARSLWTSSGFARTHGG